MVDGVSKEAIASLRKAKKTCGLISSIMKVAFSFLCVWWLYTASLMVSAIMSQSTLNSAQDVSVSSLIIYLAHGIIVAAICVPLIQMFSDSAKGDSPFTMIQAKRLRIISVMLVLYSVTEFIVSIGAAFMKVDGTGFGYASYSGDPLVTFNLAPIVAAAVIYAFSFVFKYGVLLQELSDETL